MMLENIVALEWTGKLQIEALLLQAALWSTSNSLGIFHVACIGNCHHTLQGCIHSPSQHRCIKSSQECTAAHSESHGVNVPMPVQVSLVQTNKMSAQHNFTDYHENLKLFFPHVLPLVHDTGSFPCPSPHTASLFHTSKKKGELDTVQPYEKQRFSQLDTSTDIHMLGGGTKKRHNSTNVQ